jgi:hypothetical protein
MKATYAASVFINCPFDSGYRSMLFAATFAILDCGYQPRCAQEEEDGGDVRVEKIKRMIQDCKFGLHDISETALGANGLPRFNMPFELGLFLGARQFGDSRQKSKVTLIVDREPHRYQAFLSDIAGQDIRSHEGNAETLIMIVRNWLSTSTKRKTIPGAAAIRQRYRDFTAQLPELCAGLQLQPDDLLFNEFTLIAASWLSQRDQAA